jgi:RNA polymerase sigma-70 factor (ECF subfamily)
VLDAAKAVDDELDPAIVRAAQDGDPRARRRLVVLYQDRVFHLLRRLVAPAGLGAAEVEDLAQDTFMRAFAALPRFDAHGPARLSTWILTIATRRSIDRLRAANRHSTSVTDPDALPGDGDAEHRLLRGALLRAMGELAPDQRAAFVLRHYHGLDYAEIAAALGVRPGTVASRLARARAALAAALEGEDR